MQIDTQPMMLSIKNHTAAVISLLFTLALSGCVNLSSPPGATSFTAQQQSKRAQDLTAIKQWSIQGAFSITSPSDQEIANYTWELKDQKHFTIMISSTLNLYQLNITQSGTVVTLVKDQKQPLIADNIETLMQKTLGYALPVDNLYYWIRGLAAPGQHQAVYNDYGLLTQLQQNGWSITFLNYKHHQQVDLPQLIRLQGHDLKVKLVIKHWNTSPSTSNKKTP